MRVVCIYLPRGGTTDADSSAADAIYATRAGALPGQNFWHLLDDLAESIWEPFSLEYYSKGNIIYVCMAGEDSIVEYLITGIYTWLGSSEIRDIPDYTQQTTPRMITVGCDFKMWRPDIYPTTVWKGLKFSSIGPVISALSQMPEGDQALVQIVVYPLKDTPALHLKLAAARAQERFITPFRPRNWLRRDLPTTGRELIVKKCSAKLFSINYRIASFTEAPSKSGAGGHQAVVQRLSANVQKVVDACKHYNTLDQNRLIPCRMEEGKSILNRLQRRTLVRPFRVSSEELSTFFQVPGAGGIPNAAQVLSKKAPAPMGLPLGAEDKEISLFGHTNYRDVVVPFGIRRPDRQRHMYVVGKSGSGKSCLLQLLLRHDIEQGFGCAVLDPHGDLVDDILKLIPRHRADDVVIFDPSDPSFAPSFNPMHAVRPEFKTRVIFSFLDSFRRIFGSDWSERMDHVLRYAMLGIIHLPGANILTLRRLLSEESFRNDAIRNASDESVKRFWFREYPLRRKEFDEGPISRLLNRLDELLATETLRNIFGQPKNLFDFRDFMDSRKIVLLKISKGSLGSENAELLGTLLIWKIYEAAMSRADIPAEDRQDFYFYIDEFQNFATESFGEILSESRKYRLCLTFANQYLGQLNETIRRTVFGNVTNFLSFRVGAEDAGLVSSELAPRFSGEDVVNLALREFYLKMSINGEIQEAFSGRTLDLKPLPDDEQGAQQAQSSSRVRYCIPIDQAREQVAKAMR